MFRRLALCFVLLPAACTSQPPIAPKSSVPIKEGTCYGVNVSADGRKIYVAGGGSTLTVYDAATLKPLKVLQMASDGMDLRRIAR